MASVPTQHTNSVLADTPATILPTFQLQTNLELRWASCHLAG